MSEMKQSGVPWLGKIPEEWLVEPCKYLFSHHKDVAGEDSVKYERLALTMQGVIKRSKEDLDGLQPKDFDGYQIVNKDDLIFKLIDLAGVSTSRVGLSDYQGLVSPAYILLHCKEAEIDKRYALYFFLSMWHRLIFNEIGNGGIRSSLNSKDLLNVPFTKPSIDEQRKIAAFLDSKCAAIDEAIERHKKAVDKLNEYKRASIVNIVFSGLREEAKKENKEWFGALPYGWNYARIKYLLSERNERSEDGKEDPLTMSQKVGIIPTKDFGETPHGAATFVGAKKVYLDDLVFNKLKAHLGVFSVSKYNGLVSPDYAVYYTNGKANPKYLEYVFKTPQCIAEFIKRITGVGQGLMRLYTDELFDITCPCPSIEEQNEIALYLDDLCNKISNAQQKQYDIITKLEEYRKSLIYHAVTGKIDCRGENAS